MELFWNKTTGKNSIIYTRNKLQKKAAYLVMLFGFLIMLGPYFLTRFNVVQQFYASISGPAWLGFLPLVIGGLIVIVDALFVSYVNFIILFAKSRNKKYEITISSTGEDKVVIEK